MQPDGPYRFTHVLGGCQVGKAWAAIDGQGRLVTVAVLDAAVAATPAWREAFSATANAMAQTQGGQPFVYADFAATAPWVAYPAEAGPGAEKLFRALGMDYQPVPGEAASPGADVPSTSGPVSPAAAVPHQVSGPPQQVSGPPQSVSGVPQSVSGVPQSVSGVPQVSAPPHAPWAMHGGPIPVQPVSAAPQPVSGAGAEASTVDPVFPDADRPSSDDLFAGPVRRIKPSAPPPRRTGLWVGVAAAALAVAVGAGATVWAVSGDEKPTDPQTLPTTSGTAAFPSAPAINPGLKPWAQAAPYSVEERSLAIAAPSMVFVEAVFTGTLREAKSNVPLSVTPVTFKRRCSGFVVNADGHIVTNGQCVRPAVQAARERALYTLGRILIEQKRLTAPQLDEYVRGKLNTSVFTGAEPGSEPVSQVFAQFNVARGDLTASPAIPGQIVRVLEPDAGNLALVKLTQPSLPAVELADGGVPGPGAALLVMGYRTTDADFRAATYTVESKPAQVAGTANQGSVSVSRLNDDVGIYSAGGVALDTTGRVVGVLDTDRAASGTPNRALVPVSVVTGLLEAGGTSNGRADTDKVYRDGLDAFFAGRNDDAIASFDRVAQASPVNLLAQAYRQNAVDRARLADESDGPPRLLLALLAGLGGVLLVGLIVLVVVFLRRRPRY
ncbi:trypsin-like peptidase domain-containing protein [Micromonospora lupini]|uniref:trypsin-like peptidase domain-containing protein n=1 Tax=Micromonospora lupini TaxID=285679 RepID=UPI00225597E5|nr:trypsin-like peptidase domain-containing protein [Micromonospora lupini]MCX5069540.1 trypsin-like peptidase domain-containing protein [Micromonospora lupini]